MPDLKVLMLPHITEFKREESGIRRVVEAYFKYLPDYGIKLVKLDAGSYDLKAVHAGATGGDCNVAHCHGLYWTGDLPADDWEWSVNSRIIEAVRHARAVTVPSSWVAETFQRDMRFTPAVIPHGIDWDAWQGGGDVGDYVLWNKNRISDVCDPGPVARLAHAYPKGHFVSTFLPYGASGPRNINAIGLIPHAEMKKLVQGALVYLANVKETFGLGILEAMAAGVPVLGYDHGGIRDLVEHGTNGYLVAPGNEEGLVEGLAYCIQHRATLGANGRDMARAWTWPAAVEKVAQVYREAAQVEPPSVGVVIPVYNKTIEELRRSIESVLDQSHQPASIVVIDDGSTGGADYEGLIRELGADAASDIMYRRYDNSGVAIARNRGIELIQAKYVCCLDADDWLAPDFLRVCVQALERDSSLGIAYTGLIWHKPDGSSGRSEWPGEWDFDAQLNRQNQVPTACVFRRDMWQRLGGYNQRYAPTGAGAEDAEFWTRAGAYGWRAELVNREYDGQDEAKLSRYIRRLSKVLEGWDRHQQGERWQIAKQRIEDAKALRKEMKTGQGHPVYAFHYSWLSGQVTGNPDYEEVDWLAWHPWVRDGLHPFASYATPERFSHAVRQYDTPTVSVIIPVGPGHEKAVTNALDSLEAQTFRKWEAIVVWDQDGFWPDSLETAYPYVNWRKIHKGPYGAGNARNKGVDQARAPFLLFLDADDWLYPDCLAKMIEAWNKHEAIIYTDYIGKAIINDIEQLAPDLRGRVLAHDGVTKETAIEYHAFEYSCERALRQPESETPYIWCNVTALIPKTWHEQIGGFDESMRSWEDVDYHWRLARAGRCYLRLPEPLMVYQFHTGSRRDMGLQEHENLVKYLIGKYQEVEPMGCSGCPGNNPVLSERSPTARSMASSRAAPAPTGRVIEMPLAIGGTKPVSDADLVEAQYVRPGRGDHKVIGPVTGIFYGYRQGGDIIPRVHKDDIASGVFQRVLRQPAEPPPDVPVEVAPPEPLPGVSVPVEPPEFPGPEAETAIDLQTLPGVTPAIAAQLEGRGIQSADALLDFGTDGLESITGVGPVKAAQIMAAVEAL